MASGGGAEEELPDEDVQGPPSGPGYPSLQVHLVNMVLPICEFVLGGQDVHDSGPALVLNVPSEHKSHGPPSGPKEPAGHLIVHLPAPQLAQVPPLVPEKPALHLQSDKSSLAAEASELAGHFKHIEDDFALTAAENLPAPHSLQE